FGPDKNVVWKTPVPFGHSSPVIGGELIFLTGAEGGARADAGREKVVDPGGKLYTLAVERATGKIRWRREVPRPRLERYQPTNSPASPSPVTMARTSMSSSATSACSRIRKKARSAGGCRLGHSTT